jgi:Abnormal spindle-like microcephaly-assoc'd, ASPM-SPD-2-Hydin
MEIWMRRPAGLVFPVLLASALAWWSTSAAAEQACTTRVANTASLACGDANRGMVLYGQTPTAATPYTWSCNQCHSSGSAFPPTPLSDSHTRGSPPVPVLLRAAPRDPGYIDLMMNAQPEVAPIAAAIEGCCIDDRPPNNVWGDLGDIAEFLYTCKVGIAPCVTGGGGGTMRGPLQGSGARDFGNQGVGSTSAPLTLTLTNLGTGMVTISNIASSNAAEFLIASNTCTTLAASASCSVTITFHPSAAGARTATVTVTSDGLYSPQTFVFSGTGSTANYEGIWWNASESGWGISFEHQGTKIFATWFTYDTAGMAWWLFMTADAGPGNTFTGTMFKTTGSFYAAAPFTAGAPVAVGTGTLTFTDTGHATFESIVNGTKQTKSITPQVFGPLPTCTYSVAANLAGATNYQGLWWNASESGWGINLAHQGSTIFAAWFTFDVDGSPLWLSATLYKGAGETFAGKLQRTTASPFAAAPFVGNPPVAIGDATLTFANGNSANFGYTIGDNGPITKQITHLPLGETTAGTVCN